MSTPTPIEIRIQGAPVAADATIRYDAGFIKVIDINMSSKYCFGDGAECDEDSGCGVYIHARTEEGFYSKSIHLNNSVSPDEPTLVMFTDFPTWSVLGFGPVCKWTIQVIIIDKSRK